MDARVIAEPVLMELETVAAEAVTVIVVDDLAIELVSLFDAAFALSPLRNMGNSVTAVAPDLILIGGERVQAYV